MKPRARPRAGPLAPLARSHLTEPLPTQTEDWSLPT